MKETSTASFMFARWEVGPSLAARQQESIGQQGAVQQLQERCQPTFYSWLAAGQV